MTEVYEKTAGLLLLIALGCLLRRAGIFKKQDAETISQIMMHITLPCIVVKNLNGLSLNRDILLAAAIGLAANAAFFLLALLASRRDGPDGRVVKIFSLSSFNIGNYVIPVVSSLVSPAALAGVLAFNYPGTALFTYGIAPLAGSMAYEAGNGRSLSLLREKLTHNPPTMTCLAMLALALLHLQLPQAVYRVVSPISDANFALAMLSIGILLEFHFPKEQRRCVFGLIGLRLAAAAVSAGVLYFFIPMGDELRRTLVLAVFAPIASCNPALALHCGYRGSQVALINSAYLPVGILCISALMLLLY